MGAGWPPRRRLVSRSDLDHGAGRPSAARAVGGRLRIGGTRAGVVTRWHPPRLRRLQGRQLRHRRRVGEDRRFVGGGCHGRRRALAVMDARRATRVRASSGAADGPCRRCQPPVGSLHRAAGVRIRDLADAGAAHRHARQRNLSSGVARRHTRRLHLGTRRRRRRGHLVDGGTAGEREQAGAARRPSRRGRRKQRRHRSHRRTPSRLG